MQAIDASENVDFNLHTHVECNSPLLPDSKTIVISTHVECDRIFELHFMTPNISTHALTWSATPGFQFVYRDSHFNSRTHVECDCILDLMWMSDRKISTHALTWSAT